MDVFSSLKESYEVFWLGWVSDNFRGMADFVIFSWEVKEKRYGSDKDSLRNSIFQSFFVIASH